MAHGLPSTYRDAKCRCLLCTLAHRVSMQDYWRRTHGKEPQPRVTALWRRAYRGGYSGVLADATIRQRPLPDALVQALVRLDNPRDRKP